MNHKTVSLADQVFERLESDILLGKYPRGAYLTELALVEDLGVSRTPIREALRRLEQEHIIEVSSRGILVLGVTSEDLADIFLPDKGSGSHQGGKAGKDIVEHEYPPKIFDRGAADRRINSILSYHSFLKKRIAPGNLQPFFMHLPGFCRKCHTGFR